MRCSRAAMRDHQRRASSHRNVVNQGAVTVDKTFLDRENIRGCGTLGKAHCAASQRQQHKSSYSHFHARDAITGPSCASSMDRHSVRDT